MKKLLIIVYIAINLSACKFAEKETYLLPDNYVGNVFIFGNVRNGEAKRYDSNHHRLYLIPASGILLTKFKPTYGIINKIFCYRTKGDVKIKLEGIVYQDEKATLNPEKIYAFYGNDATVTFPKTKDTISTQIVTICKPGDFETFSNDPFVKKINKTNFSSQDLTYARVLQMRDELRLKNNPGYK